MHTLISDTEHNFKDPEEIKSYLKLARNKWRACKKNSAAIRQKFLEERAAFFASKLQCSEEKALCAIIRAEESKRIYSNIREILGKQPNSLTQMDIIDPQGTPRNTKTPLTSREEVEHSIMQRNCRHSLQSLVTPFMSNSH
jgi:hypothetical protein